jgi:glycosyltransferase involved in cell wall biosynthesis
VALIDHTARMGGGEVALLNLVMSFDERLVKPIVILFSEGPLAEELRKHRIDVEMIPLSQAVLETRKGNLGARSLLKVGVGLKTLRQALRVARRLRKLRVDLVHTNSLKADIIGGIAGRLARRPVIWHVRDRIAEDYLPRTTVRLFRRLMRMIPQYVIANSAATMETLQLPKLKRAAVVHSGIRSFSRIVHDGTVMEQDELLRPMGGQEPVVGLVGRIARWKGQHVFIRAAELVRRRFPAARFRIVGTPLFGEEDYEREIRELTAQLGLAEVLEFAGFSHDVPATMRGFSVAVHASITGEPFGQVVIEAMAAGRPVVATNGGGIPEIVEDGLTGYLVPMDDAPAMADAICRLLADPAAAAEMGRRGRQRVIDRFTIEHTARRVEAVYADLLHKRSGS